MKISIIVPVYNTAKYLPNCFDSIIAQTYTDYEVIAVDDGSTDGSAAICDQYAERDSRFRVVHKSNEGVSVARNIGIDNASGQYLAFFDSDDTILPTMLEDLIRIAEAEDCDIVQSAGALKDGVAETGIIKKMSRDKVLDENFAFSNVYKPSLWLGLYKATLFNGIRFPKNIHFYEDFVVLTLLANKSNGVVFVDKRYYNYIQREESATHSGLTSKRRSCLLIPNYLMEKGVFRNDTDLNNTIGFFIYGQLITTILADDVKESDTEFIKNEIHKNIKRILKAPRLNILMRIYCIFYLFLPSVVTKIIRFRHDF